VLYGGVAPTAGNLLTRAAQRSFSLSLSLSRSFNSHHVLVLAIIVRLMRDVRNAQEYHHAGDSLKLSPLHLLFHLLPLLPSDRLLSRSADLEDTFYSASVARSTDIKLARRKGKRSLGLLLLSRARRDDTRVPLNVPPRSDAAIDLAAICAASCDIASAAVLASLSVSLHRWESSMSRCCCQTSTIEWTGVRSEEESKSRENPGEALSIEQVRSNSCVE